MSLKRHNSNDDSSSGETHKNHLSKKLKRSDSPLDELSECGQLTQEDVVYYQKEAIYRLLSLSRSRNKRLKRDMELVNNNYEKLQSKFLVLNSWWFQIVENFQNFDRIKESSPDFNESLLINIQSDNDEKLKQLRQKLISLIQPLLSIEPSNKEDKLVSLQESLTNLNLFKNQLQDENNLLKDKIEELNQELDSFIKQKDRSESKTLDRITEVKKENERDGSPVANGDSVKTNGTTATTNGTVDAVEVENLKVEIDELKAKNSELTSQLTEKLNLMHKLETKLLTLQNNFSNLTEADLLKSSIYQALVKKNTELSSELSKLKYESSKIEAQFLEFESNQTKNETKLREKLTDELNANNNYVSKIENDLNRVRSDRDELQSKYSILKAEKGKSELTAEYKKLNETLEKRIQELEARVEGNLTVDESDSSPKDMETLMKHNKLLSLELKQLEEAFKSARQTASAKLSKYADSEHYINKLTIEKNKADQKYFQAMRSKDALSSQDKRLKKNYTRSCQT
ncbi:unnamed protein product [Ambrosiozyma monospora]|uniref:Unnamed protein product n=1 Tax=Ambrosiozyma monospora TaxID=43982 RepID=A0ACB5SW98_AMBMO|nr:unnamed protein product [Ambrosiozyma monospora]